ncbi:hypothetical protein ASPACDRAFT_119902 [Aspergillus aculeatus ATCC 16872]|uniref:Uncharacterized protein n=1 Tax=Aspergillus aculeatus (strain ATCC 16872 / CBS 172.66 / WB 5094) TaxID=690307 RepID=A0A1L9WUP6_ASPA1|nr:uncharacterized protein ASPACDRAFT_119902 [Aspergillus aculeatus ATCC 16872]OJJ99976.1 hypothetical protein ASPACDRAFT_119902 [Aspergillus aculeatus ATCC 16872]
MCSQISRRSTVLYPNILNSRSNSYEVEESDAKGPATLNEQHSRRSASSTPLSSYDSGPDIPFHAATTSTPTVTRHSHSPVTAAPNNKPTADPPNYDNTDTDTDTDTDIPNPFSISSKPIKGPPIPFPRYLQAEIAKWHEATRGQRRKKRPPFSYRGEGVIREYKVFDRTGQELQLCQYPLKSPRTNVLVAYEATAAAGAGPPRTGSDSESSAASASAPPGGKIVVCSLPHSSPFGTFLRQWTPAEQDPPPPSCAVRVWRMKPGQEIVYNPAAWEFIDGWRERGRQQEGRAMAPADVRQRPQERRVSEWAVPARSARSKSAQQQQQQQQQQQKVVANTTRVASISSDRDSSPLSEVGDDTDEELSSVSEPIQQTRRVPKRQQQPVPTSSSSPPVPKRRKTNHADPLSLRKVTGGLVFVLCSEDKPKRFVIVATCNTVDDLFAQALDFFRLHYKLTELKYLCCETEAHGEVWLPRGGHDEFDYMVWVALDSLKGKDNVPAVEIKVRPVIIP